MSERNVEQRIKIKLYANSGKSGTETLDLLRGEYGESAMKKSSVFEWHRRFKEGREEVRDDARSGQPKTQRTADNVDRVRALALSDRRLSVRSIAHQLGMNRETVRQIMTEELGMTKVGKRPSDATTTDDDTVPRKRSRQKKNS